MSAEKLTACLTIALLAAIASEVVSAPHYVNENYATNVLLLNSCSIGYGNYNDRMVVLEPIVVNGSGTLTKTFTKTFTRKQWENITLLQVVNQKPMWNATCESVITGGPGVISVALKFKSLKSKGINFNLEVYAVPRYWS